MAWLTLSVSCVAALGIALAGALEAKEYGKDFRYERERIRLVSSTVTAVALALWPAVFELVVGCDQLEHPYVAAVFLWPVILLAFDLMSSRVRSRETNSEEQARTLDIKNNGLALVGGAWAIGALLGALNGRQGGHSKHGSVAILVALLIAIGLLLPTPETHVSSVTSITIRSGQKAMLNYAIGLFVVGVILTWKDKSVHVGETGPVQQMLPMGGGE